MTNRLALTLSVLYSITALVIYAAPHITSEAVRIIACVVCVLFAIIFFNLYMESKKKAKQLHDEEFLNNNKQPK
jgi:preprotein translocase subunit SecY